MKSYLIILAAAATGIGSLVAVHAATQPVASIAAPAPAQKMLTTTRDGKPILLERMVVVDTALPEESAANN